MSMTVLHILNTGSYSGAENVVITIIQAFKRYGYDTRFIYVSLGGSIRDVLKINGIPFEPIKKMCSSELKRVKKKYKPDIIHAHDFTASIMCAVISGKTPVISHIHNNSPWIKKYCMNSFAYLVSCIKYKKILGVSKSVFDEYVFEKIIRSKSMVVGNPIDISRIRELSNNADNKFSYDVVFLGRLTEQKAPHRFVEIILQAKKNIPSISAVMVGDGEMRSEIETLITEMDLKDNITITGFISNPYGLLKNSKILCIPSKWEGFGLVAVEALALNKPVLASPVGGLSNIVDNSCGCLCRNNNEFVDEIVNLLQSKQYMQSKIVGAEQRVKMFDNMKDYIERLKSVYAGLMR